MFDKIYIQETALSTWGHYYICPKCTVALTFDYHSPDAYTCPNCGEVFTGEPYKGGWWAHIAYKNAHGAYDLAVAYLATDDDKYLKPAKEIILGYAKYYPDYEVHGGIPYNNPGKLNAQVLDDSAMLNYYTRAYDIIRDSFTDEEQTLIEKNLFICGAEHLKKNLTPQLHNHEVCICSALANIGLVTGNDEILDFALNHKYGLKYQLDNGFLEDFIWFEGSMGYHFYALNWILRYEHLARNTKYSLLSDEHYKNIIYNALTAPMKLCKKDGSFPKLNDGSSAFASNAYIYEYAYSYFGDDKLLLCLNQAVKDSARDDIYALLYGADNLVEAELEKEDYLAENGSQLAIINGSDDRYFLFKAMPYGGEHDHYDRLAISFSAFSSDVCADMGTAHGYGAPLHYAYFKNTGAHNTVVINGDNMPPAATVINEYTKKSDSDIYLDAQTVWSKDFVMPDSFTIKQWNDKSYESVKMRRVIQWCDKYFIDIFKVDSKNTLPKDWTLHIDGILQSIPDNAQVIERFSDKNPQTHLHDVSKSKGIGMMKFTYACSGFDLNIHTFAEGKDIIFARGSANPSTKDISYILERSLNESVVYVNVIEACKHGEEVIDFVSAEVSDGKIKAVVHEKSGNVKTVNI